MFNTIKEIKDIAECIPGYTAVYKIKDDTIERIYYSKHLFELNGYTEEEIETVGVNPMSLIYSEDVDGVTKKIKEVVRAHGKIDLSYRLVHKTGKLVWVRTHGNYIGEMDDADIYLISMYNVTSEWDIQDSILDSSDRGVVVFDRDTKMVLYGNEKFFKFAQTTKEDCLGGLCYNVVCKAGVYDSDKCICFKAIGQSESLVTYNPTNDKYFAINASEIMWGEHAAIIFYMLDVTEETKKDQEIAEKNEKLRLMQEEAIQTYKKQLEMITDGDTDILSTCRLNLTQNTCIPGICGTQLMRDLQSEGTAEGYFRMGRAHLDDSDLKNMQNYPSVSTLVESFQKGVESISEDAYFKIKDGRTMYVRTTVHMAKNPITHDIEAILFTRDLTGTKLQNDIMRCLMEKQYESISVINLENRKVSVMTYNYDDVAKSEYEGEDYDICRKFFTDTYVLEEDRKSYWDGCSLEQITKSLDTEGVYSLMFHFKTETGEILHKTIEYYYSNERHNTIIGATRDITEITRKQRKNLDNLKEALLRADKATEAKSAFFSNISHDMRTPLNGILGFSRLGGEALTLEEARLYFDKIQSSGEFLLKLINDTLDISKIESGQMKLKFAPVNMCELLQETVNSVEEAAHEKGVNFQVKCPTDNQLYVSTDKLRLEQLLTNLIGNAIKFTPKGGTVNFNVIELAQKEDGCNYKITILDNGCGMSKEFVPHAFEAYSQDDRDTPAKASGTGLGLAIVKQIVTLMKGKIILASEEGKGTRFDIWLPLDVVVVDKKKEASDNIQTNLEGKHILLCEDHPINRELACRLLERKGMKITCADNGEIGLEIFKASKIGDYDAILMDIRMPKMNGLETTEAIRNLNRDDATTIPIIAMTANAYESDKNKAIRFGMNAHLSKPIDPKTMYHMLDKYINTNTQQGQGDKDEKWKPKVIIVDDIDINIIVLKTAIEENYKVLEAHDGHEALQILKEESGVAAVITDIQMPNMDGIQLIKEIRSNHEYDHIAILANTQVGEPSQEEDLLAMGADSFVYKPTVAPIILTRLNTIITKYK